MNIVLLCSMLFSAAAAFFCMRMLVGNSLCGRCIAVVAAFVSAGCFVYWSSESEPTLMAHWPEYTLFFWPILLLMLAGIVSYIIGEDRRRRHASLRPARVPAPERKKAA
jgi:hypothetical protein